MLEVEANMVSVKRSLRFEQVISGILRHEFRARYLLTKVEEKGMYVQGNVVAKGLTSS